MSAPATTRLGERDWPRIHYGREADAHKHPRCPDCGIEPGELHVTDCDVEQSPVCGLQLLMCHELERHEAVRSGDWDDSPWAGEPYGPPAADAKTNESE